MGHQVNLCPPFRLRYYASSLHTTLQVLCFVKPVHAYQAPQRSQAFQGA
jgi:hypothetical protein